MGEPPRKKRLARSHGTPIVELAPPISSTAWSADFVFQSIEILPVALRAGGLWWFRPEHALSLRVGWPPAGKPGEIVVQALARYGLTPLLVHSTSWRHEGDEIVLTYVAAVDEPGESSEMPPRMMEVLPVGRAALARGDALGPPTDIGIEQVVEHAFRHLAWLLADDAVVGETLGEWASQLRAYEPEPFRAFGEGATDLLA